MNSIKRSLLVVYWQSVGNTVSQIILKYHFNCKIISKFSKTRHDTAFTQNNLRYLLNSETAKFAVHTHTVRSLNKPNTFEHFLVYYIIRWRAISFSWGIFTYLKSLTGFMQSLS